MSTPDHENLPALDWVPESCTLPTIEQPVRTAEFDDLFRDAVVRVEQQSESVLMLELMATPENGARAARLAAHETDCCSLFTFALTISHGSMNLIITTPHGQEHILAALGERARAHGASVSRRNSAVMSP